MALDISSVCVGWSIFDDGELTSHGKYHHKGKGHGEKLTNFDEWFTLFLSAEEPHVVVVERPYPGRNKNAYRVLTMYIGKVVELHWQHFGAEMAEDDQLASSTVKRELGIPKGESHDDNKRLAVEHINALYGLALKYRSKDRDKKHSDDDVADAIALNQAWHIVNRPEVA